MRKIIIGLCLLVLTFVGLQAQQQQMQQLHGMGMVPGMPPLPSFQGMSNPNSGSSALPPSMDPLRVFSSSLVPKKVLITTQVRVKFNSL